MNGKFVDHILKERDVVVRDVYGMKKSVEHRCVGGVKDLWCSGIVRLLSARIIMNECLGPIYVRLSLESSCRWVWCARVWGVYLHNHPFL